MITPLIEYTSSIHTLVADDYCGLKISNQPISFQWNTTFFQQSCVKITKMIILINKYENGDCEKKLKIKPINNTTITTTL